MHTESLYIDASRSIGIAPKCHVVYVGLWQEEAVLEKLVKMQGLARREGWYDNLTAVLFTVSDDQPVVITEDSAKVQDITQIEQQIEEEFDREKEEALKAGMLDYVVTLKDKVSYMQSRR